MTDSKNALEGLKLINDWAKWLITIETGAIAIIGAMVRPEKGALSQPVKVLATGAIISYLISIAAAALLLLSLPEIAQKLSTETNIWMTRDSIIGRVFRTDIQGFAVIESFFFGLGIVLLSAMIIAVAWSPISPTSVGGVLPTPSPSVEQKSVSEPGK